MTSDLVVWISQVYRCKLQQLARKLESYTSKFNMMWPLFFFFMKMYSTCPDFITQKCACQEFHNGVVLDCSNHPGYEIMELIRENQVLLGLIQSLTLKNGNLREFPSAFFNGLYIKKLDLSHNFIKIVPKKAFDGMHPVLEEFVLSNNQLEKVPIAPLTVFPSLLLLDLSNNKIKDIDEDSIVPTMTKLRDLNLGNNSISFLHTNSFQNIKNSIQTINLGHNQLTSVPSSAIRGLKQLESLHLHHNRIEQLDALTFLNLPILNMLNLAGNQIKELNLHAFLNVPSLRYLYLSNNRIEKLVKYQFQTFEKLEMLDLTNNSIMEMPEECLSGLKHLHQLYLGNNRINYIKKDAFANSSITLLVLSNNKLNKITADTLNGLTNLQQVSFRNNMIDLIDQNAFYSVPSLVMLDLAQNNLTDLKSSTFLAQLDMRFVDLSENKFEITPFSAFNKKIGTVMLRENPLVCVEKIHMLQDGVGITINDNKDKICRNAGEQLTPAVKPRREQKVPRIQIHKNVQNRTIEDKITQKHSDYQTNIENSRLIVNRNTNMGFSIPTEQEKLPTREDEVGVDSIPSMNTTSIPIHQINNSKNRMLPLPIPFLKMGPAMSRAKSVQKATNISELLPTLPPSIVIEPMIMPRLPLLNSNAKANEIGEVLMTSSQKSETNTSEIDQKLINTTTVMLICVGIASVVLLLIITGLCISKHRQIQIEQSLPSRNTVNAENCASSKLRDIILQAPKSSCRFSESPAWIYNPGSSYCNYYK